MYFASLFSHFASLFSLFAFHSILRQSRRSRENSKDLVVYFFAALIKHEICMKCEKCIESVSYFMISKMRKVYSRPNESLSTHHSHFPRVLSFRQFSRIVCSGLQSYRVRCRLLALQLFLNNWLPDDILVFATSTAAPYSSTSLLFHWLVYRLFLQPWSDTYPR